MKLSIKVALIILVGLSISVILANYVISPIFDAVVAQSATMDASTIFIQNLIKLVLIFTLAVAPVAALIWALITRMIIIPISSMNEVTKIIASGNLGESIKFQSTDELGDLSSNINQMIKSTATAFQNMANSLRDTKINEYKLLKSVNDLEESKGKTNQALAALTKEKSMLQEEKSKDEAILSSIDDGVMAVDKDGKIILFNWAASVISGYSREDALGSSYHHILQVFKEKENVAAEDFLQQSLAGKKISTISGLVLIRRDEDKIPVAISSAPIFDPNWTTQGAVLVFRDMTRERQLEKLKDEFVSIASHELRTPMTAIKGLISMIFEGDYGPLNEELKDPLDDVAVSTDRLIHLVNELLNVSRIEAGRLKFELTDFSMKDAVEEITASLQPIAKQRNLFLEASLIHDHLVQGDSDKIKEILSNLIGNALKFTDKGGIRVQTTVLKDLMQVMVSDTGEGISAPDQAKLFAKFQQISTQQTGRPEGTGLGLYISRELARKLGGNLWIEHSVLGQGSIFAFSLPLTGSLLAKSTKESLEKQGVLKAEGQ